jgi:hypothetical protein
MLCTRPRPRLLEVLQHNARRRHAFNRHVLLVR